MSAKEDYSTNVETARQQAADSVNAAVAWNKGRAELNKYRNVWEPININDCVPKFYDPSLVKVNARKMFFPTKDRKIVIIADFAGGYLRFMDVNTGKYTDKNGNIVQGDKKYINDHTHYRILKKEEM